ncbi:hypothetical protein DB345_06130 [Spartobacteria bacterium LR76]|nr:hypothetical protein DB345_06130 [Spartobacteria bacterium LR76]
MNRLLPLLAIMVCLALATASARSRTIVSFPFQNTGTGADPWTVMLDRDVLLASPQWTDPAASEPPFPPDKAIQIALDVAHSLSATTGISLLSINKTTLYETSLWYYEITMEGDPAGILKRNGCDKIYILMDGTRLKPSPGRLDAVYEKQ